MSMSKAAFYRARVKPPKVYEPRRRADAQVESAPARNRPPATPRKRTLSLRRCKPLVVGRHNGAPCALHCTQIETRAYVKQVRQAPRMLELK